MNYDIPLVVNSINHPESKRTFVTYFLHPFFNSITFIPTYITTFINLFLMILDLLGRGAPVIEGSALIEGSAIRGGVVRSCNTVLIVSC